MPDLAKQFRIAEEEIQSRAKEAIGRKLTDTEIERIVSKFHDVLIERGMWDILDDVIEMNACSHDWEPKPPCVVSGVSDWECRKCGATHTSVDSD